MRTASYKHRRTLVNGGPPIYLDWDFDSTGCEQGFASRSIFSLTVLREE
jgi:hypothetical protein